MALSQPQQQLFINLNSSIDNIKEGTVSLEPKTDQSSNPLACFLTRDHDEIMQRRNSFIRVGNELKEIVQLADNLKQELEVKNQQNHENLLVFPSILLLWMHHLPGWSRTACKIC